MSDVKAHVKIPREQRNSGLNTVKVCLEIPIEQYKFITKLLKPSLHENLEDFIRSAIRSYQEEKVERMAMAAAKAEVMRNL
ncbi:MAG: hypothetical protein QXR42_08020 [Candidatus Bathyarchaeia archaeon]